MQHRDAGDAHIAVEPLDHLVGLLEIRGAHIHRRRGLFGIAQELGAGEGADVGGAGFGRHRRRGPRSRGPDRADEREDILLAEELAGVFERRLGFVAVVQRDQLQPPPVDAAPPVHFGKGGLDAEPHPLAEGRRRAAERTPTARTEPVRR